MDFLGLLPSFGNLLFTLGAFIVALSVIVAIHEYGHYIVGRWCGIKADVFSIGFGPVLASRRDRHGTVWQIGALPFGGFVKFMGDASAVSDRADDEVMDNLDQNARRHTMHGAPLWARSATVIAGPLFNFILSFLVFAAFIFFQGIASDPLVIKSVRATPFEIGDLRTGDQILSVDGEATPEIAEVTEFFSEIPPGDQFEYVVLRDGEEVVANGPHPYPAIVFGVNPGSAAQDAGLEPDDVVIAVDGEPVTSFFQLRDRVQEGEGAAMALTIWRDGETLTLTLIPRQTDLPRADGSFETRWLIGFTGGMLFEAATESPGLWGAAQYGVNQIFFIIRSSLSALYHMIAGEISTCNIQGPIGIAETSGSVASQGGLNFIWFIAVLSTAVGMMNLFPIPVLDGGHLVFHAWEAITGNPPSDGALRVMMGVGIALMGALMVFALTNDILC